MTKPKLNLTSQLTNNWIPSLTCPRGVKKSMALLLHTALELGWPKVFDIFALLYTPQNMIESHIE